MSLEQQVDVLERQVRALRHQVHVQGEQIEVLQSPPWKRWLWFVPQGWRPYSVGRWYHKTPDLR